MAIIKGCNNQQSYSYMSVQQGDYEQQSVDFCSNFLVIKTPTGCVAINMGSIIKLESISNSSGIERTRIHQSGGFGNCYVSTDVDVPLDIILSAIKTIDSNN